MVFFLEPQLPARTPWAVVVVKAILRQNWPYNTIDLANGGGGGGALKKTVKFTIETAGGILGGVSTSKLERKARRRCQEHVVKVFVACYLVRITVSRAPQKWNSCNEMTKYTYKFGPSC